MSWIPKGLEQDGYQTWDGEPVTREAPFGAAIVVYRRTEQGPEFLLLHRNAEGPDYEGDWAWGAPSGARFPGENIDDCARRELLEETGLNVPLIRCESIPEWCVYIAEVESAEGIILSPEHDRYEWRPESTMCHGVGPAIVREQLRAAAEFIREQ